MVEVEPLRKGWHRHDEPPTGNISAIEQACTTRTGTLERILVVFLKYMCNGLSGPELLTGQLGSNGTQGHFQYHE